MSTFFIPLAKIDEEKRLVIGRAVQEVVDRTNEILDYATARPAFEKWSSDFNTISNGLSKGNLRVMHDPKKVAGKVVNLSYDDDDKAIDVVAKVVDDDAWKKVLEGVFTGFSVGGGYGRKWKDEATGATRYTPIVTELSLVDNPCIPTARIAELHKSDGSTQMLHLSGRARTFEEIFATPRPRSFEEILAGTPPRHPPFSFEAHLAKAQGAATFNEADRGDLAKGLVNAAGRFGGWAGRKIAAAGTKTNARIRSTAEAGQYLHMRSKLGPNAPSSYPKFREARASGRADPGVDRAVHSAGSEAVADRAARFHDRGVRIGKDTAKVGAGAVGGAAAYGAVAMHNRSRELSEAQLRQRKEAAKSGAEKRKGAGGGASNGAKLKAILARNPKGGGSLTVEARDGRRIRSTEPGFRQAMKDHYQHRRAVRGGDA